MKKEYPEISVKLTGGSAKPIQRKHISTLMVLLAYLEYKENNDKRPYEILQEKTNAHYKVVWAAIERDIDRGYIEYGVSMNVGWLTEKGIEYLNQNTHGLS